MKYIKVYGNEFFECVELVELSVEPVSFHTPREGIAWNELYISQEDVGFWNNYCHLVGETCVV